MRASLQSPSDPGFLSSTARAIAGSSSQADVVLQLIWGLSLHKRTVRQNEASPPLPTISRNGMLPKSSITLLKQSRRVNLKCDLPVGRSNLTGLHDGIGLAESCSVKNFSHSNGFRESSGSRQWPFPKKKATGCRAKLRAGENEHRLVVAILCLGLPTLLRYSTTYIEWLS